MQGDGSADTTNCVLTDQSFVCDQTFLRCIEDSDWEVEFSVETNNADFFD